MAKHLLNGSDARKIATSWRLEARLEAIQLKLHNNRAVTFNHIKREGNKVADFLANTGVENEIFLLTGRMDNILTHDQVKECTHLIQIDVAPPGCGCQGWWDGSSWRPCAITRQTVGHELAMVSMVTGSRSHSSGELMLSTAIRPTWRLQ